MTEAEFQQQVVELAQLRGWRCFHDHDSRRNAAGLPDLILVRDCRLIFAELKSAKGRVRPEQEEWMRDLRDVTTLSDTVFVYLWRPDDFDEIEKVLA